MHLLLTMFSSCMIRGNSTLVFRLVTHLITFCEQQLVLDYTTRRVFDLCVDETAAAEKMLSVHQKVCQVVFFLILIPLLHAYESISLCRAWIYTDKIKL